MRYRIRTFAAAAVVATSSIPAVATAAAPTTGRQGKVVAAYVNVRSGPGTNYAQRGRLPQGTIVYIACQKRGTRLSGPRAANWPWWDYITTPVRGWVSDAFVDSGPNERSAPNCTGTPPVDRAAPRPSQPAPPTAGPPQGNCRVDTTQYPPRYFCDPPAQAPACPHRQNGDPGRGWGGYAPGHVPLGALVRLSDTGLRSTSGYRPTKYRLRCDAAAAFTKLEQAFERALRQPLELTVGYRSYAEQAYCYRKKPGICSRPGRPGAHAFALGVDFASRINDRSSSSHAWMVANAWRYGWCHPRWARRGGSNPEPWHWEYWGEAYMTARGGRC